VRLWKRKTVEPSAREIRDDWLKWAELNGAREATLRGYRQTTERFLKRWPELFLAEITDEHILGFIEEASPASRQQRRAPFTNWFGWAARTKRIPANPMHHVPTYKVPKREPVETFTDAECKILSALPEPDGTLIALLLGSGIRKSEARHLTVRRIDFDHGELHVVEGAKGGSAGVVPIASALVNRLASYVLLEGLNENDFLWYCHPGGQKKRRHDRAITDASMHNWWARSVAAAGIPYKHLHTTRHTYAAEWRRRGASYDDVGFVLRHADPRTTKIVYAHTQIHDVRRRLEALESDS